MYCIYKVVRELEQTVTELKQAASASVCDSETKALAKELDQCREAFKSARKTVDENQDKLLQLRRENDDLSMELKRLQDKTIEIGHGTMDAKPLGDLI